MFFLWTKKERKKLASELRVRENLRLALANFRTRPNLSSVEAKSDLKQAEIFLTAVKNRSASP
jgi:ribosome-binding factor A